MCGRVHLTWIENVGSTYDIYRAGKSGKFIRCAQISGGEYMDFSIGKSDKSREYTYRVCPSGFPVDSASAFEVKAEVPAACDSVLLDMVQKYTFDLEDECDVYVLQVNYFDHETEYYNKVDGLRQRYVIEGSLDGRISQVSETVRLQ